MLLCCVLRNGDGGVVKKPAYLFSPRSCPPPSDSVVDYIISIERRDVIFKLHPNARCAAPCSERSIRKTAQTTEVWAVCSAGRTYEVYSRIEVRPCHGSFMRSYSSPRQRYRNVTICARVQSASGLNLSSPVPPVTPLAAAQATAGA